MASPDAIRLREAEDRYRSLLESIDAGFCIIELVYDAAGRPADYRFLEVNPAFESQTGLKDATRKTMREHVPGHEQHWFDIYARIAETGEPMRFVQAAKALIDGWYEVYAYRLGGPGSRRIAILFNDITERVHAVEALHEADVRKNEFLATLAHELRNPLGALSNAAALLRRGVSQDPAQQAAHAIVERQIAHMLRLVGDLSDVTSITLGKIELHREPLDLRAVAGEAAEASRALMDEFGHRFELRLGSRPLPVLGDRVRLTQVLSNLLANAARYTPRGGEIVLEAGTARGEAFATVTDSGIGIAPEMLERVFEPFLQLDDGRGGIGIGLALARRLVELHGGRIVGESEGEGRGSRFTVQLPLTHLNLPDGTSTERARDPGRELA